MEIKTTFEQPLDKESEKELKKVVDIGDNSVMAEPMNAKSADEKETFKNYLEEKEKSDNGHSFLDKSLPSGTDENALIASHKVADEIGLEISAMAKKTSNNSEATVKKAVDKNTPNTGGVKMKKISKSTTNTVEPPGKASAQKAT